MKCVASDSRQRSFDMIIENLKHTSPSPEICCRRMAMSDPGSMMELTGDVEKCIHLKRWELRRMRSLDQMNSGGLPVGDCKVIPGNGRSLKKKRPNNEDVDGSQPEEEGGERSLKRKAAVVSVSLAPSLSKQLKKDLVIEEGTSSFVDEENKAKDNKQDVVPCWSHGSISVIGRRRQMEDAVAVELGFLKRSGSKKYDFFGVYDGHGGSHVAQACRDRLQRMLVEIVEEGDDNNTNRDGGMINWEKVMSESFEKMDEEVNRNGASVATMGSTALVVVVGEEELVVANCGDSRAVLSRGGIAIPLTIDHKPDRPDELERIELSGGKVIDWNGQRVLGVLATSRSLGDHYLKPFVISEPEVTVSRRTNTDEFVILASDGLWDVISNDVACHVVRRCLDGHVRKAHPEMVNSTSETAAEVRASEVENGGLATEAASLLAELAIARGSRDNISVIVVQLKTLYTPKLVERENALLLPKTR